MLIPLIFIFFSVNQEIGKASRRSNDIPTRLAPRWTPIVCRQSQNLLKKGGKIQEGGLDQNPQKKRKRNEKTTNKRNRKN